MHLLKIFKKNKFIKQEDLDLWLFEVSVWLHEFSRALVAVFIPIFLYQTGYSVGEIMLYYFLYNVLDVPFNLASRWMVRRIGARKVIIMGSFFLVAFFVSLLSLTANNWPFLLIVALFAALYDTFYWVAHVYLFLKCSKNDDNVSSDNSLLINIRKLAGIFAPLLGVTILIFFSEKVLIAVSVIILMFSLIPLFKIKKISDKPKRKQKSFKKFFNNWDTAKDYIATCFYSIHCSAEDIIWPLFIFIIFESMESVAIIPTIVSVTTLVFTYLAGKIVKKNREAMIALASVMIALVWLTRLLFENGTFYYASIFLVGMFTIFISIPLDSCIYEKGERKDTLTASMWRNIAYMLPKMIFYGLLALSINVFNVSFVIAATSLLVIILVIYLLERFFLMRKKKKRKRRTTSKTSKKKKYVKKKYVRKRK